MGAWETSVHLSPVVSHLLSSQMSIFDSQMLFHVSVRAPLHLPSRPQKHRQCWSQGECRVSEWKNSSPRGLMRHPVALEPIFSLSCDTQLHRGGSFSSTGVFCREPEGSVLGPPERGPWAQRSSLQSALRGGCLGSFYCKLLTSRGCHPVALCPLWACFKVLHHRS